MRGLIAESKSFQLMDCICRKKTALQGRACSHSMEVCMVFFREEGALDYHHFGGRVVSREEALAVLERTEMEGLVHCTYNIRRGQVWVCNCCPCCCDLLIGLNRYKAPNLLARSNFVAHIEAGECTGCGVCARKRCPTEAIVKRDGVYAVLPERCIGCGVCVPFCPTEAIALHRRPQGERDNPPADLYTWHLARAMYRTVADLAARIRD
jgi:Fe-S-cluster-containing hydrogenase component 2